MNHFYFSLSFVLLTACVLTSTHAQVRKASLPVDTGALNVAQPVVPYDTLPKFAGVVKPVAFECGFEQQPEYYGGVRAMYKFINANLHLPLLAKEAGISGRVFLTFMVEITGEITHVTVLRGLGYGCDEEAVRMVESMPKWKPGKLYGKPVRVKYNLPVSFDAK